MRTFRICCCVLCVPLLGILGCNNSPYAKKGEEVRATTVNISGCKANPDTVQVFEGDTLTWTNDPPDGNTYTVSFKKRKPIPRSTAPTGEGQKVKKDFWCITGAWIDKNACLYAYDIIQNNSTSPCPDPGVHIVRGP